jgi:DNA-binding response OmpR family regulator
MARILLAEDDEAVSAFVLRALKLRGHEVSVAGDGLAALDALEAGNFDLLLTDIVMPGMDGIALALKASRDRPDMKILMMSGYAHERQRAHNLEALIHRVLTKPFSLEEVCKAVEEALGSP